MKTIAFYSYKGGVGRTLAIAHVAYWLSKQEKTVFMLDMDMEAPGLHYKLEQYNELPVPVKGLVDYIGHFRRTGKAAASIEEYVIPLVSKERKMEDMWLMPAGNPFTGDYWKQLSEIEWKEFLYKGEKLGSLLFLELKAHIEKAYNPDFLLIDSRTGLTDLTGIGLDLLADDAVVLGVNNPENIDGSRIVMERLRKRVKLPFKDAPTRLHFVLTRIPAPQNQFGLDREEKIKKDVLQRLNIDSGLASGPLVSDMEIVHIDAEQAVGERNRLIEKNWKKYPIAVDYERLASQVTGIEGNSNSRRFQELYDQVLFTEDDGKKRELVRELVELDTNNPDQEFKKGWIAKDILNDSDIEIKSYTNAINLRPDFFEAYVNRGAAYDDLGDNSNAIADYDAAILLKPDEAGFYHNRAMSYFKIGNFERAQNDAEMSLQLDPNEPYSYRSFAEIQSALGNKDLFYEYLKKALDLAPSQMDYLDPATLTRHQNDPQFEALLQKHKAQK